VRLVQGVALRCDGGVYAEGWWLVATGCGRDNSKCFGMVRSAKCQKTRLDGIIRWVNRHTYKRTSLKLEMKEMTTTLERIDEMKPRVTGCSRCNAGFNCPTK